MDEDDKFNRAAAAIKKNPHKSNVAIAKDIGVSKDTVRKARTATCD
jgi:predicted transcriptional regulator